ncbi:MAG TPA: CoA-transferase [Syntrophales bacterium]|nr:CoA-transferase [Syntrophales bacterium]
MTDKKYAKDYTLPELMITACAREIKDGERVLIGVGLPLLGAMLAKRTHAPNCKMAYETGSFDSAPSRTPFSVVDPDLVPRAIHAGQLTDIMSLYLQRGFIDVGFVGGAQVDKYGNLNSTCFGDYYKPSVRFPGSGGAHDFGAFARRSLIVMLHEKRRFVEKCDYITTPGYLKGGNSRYEEGLPEGTGPQAVVSSKGVFRFSPDTKEMYLDTYHSGVTLESIKENVSWDLKMSRNVRETEPPTEEQLKIIRELDPEGFFLRRGEFSKKIKAQAESMGWL